MRIRNATPADAGHIADAILMGVGMEIISDFAAPDHSVEDVRQMFAGLARREDSQYSYLNTLIAEDETTHTVAGVCIAYDGALLHPLREAFFEAARQEIGKDMEQQMTDETDADEYYIDTLAVYPEYRGRGIARLLLKAQAERAAAIGKPAGLLVDKDNERARRLYESVGFSRVGDRQFASVMMDHMMM